MEIKHLKIILRWSWLLILFPIISVGVAFWYLQQQPEVYEARVTLIIGPGIDSPNPDLNDLRAGEQLMQTYAELPRTNNFLETVINNLDLPLSKDELVDLISIRPIIGTQLLHIVVQYEDAERAVLITNDIANNLILQGPSTDTNDFIFLRIQQQSANIEQDIIDIEARIAILRGQLAIEENLVNQNLLTQQITDEEQRLADSNNTLASLYEVLQQPLTNQIEIVELATEALPVSSQTLLTLLIAASAGIILSVIVTIGLILLENDILDITDLNSINNLPIWGTVKSYPETDKLVVIDATNSPIARQYYQIGAQLLYQRDTEDIQSILFTSVSYPDPVPEIVANLAIAVARSQNSVFLLDVNFRNNQIEDMFNLHEATKLSELLTTVHIDQMQFKKAEPYPNLQILPSGPATTEHSFDMLASPKMLQILSSLKKDNKKYGNLFITASPIPDMEDSLTLVSQVDAVVLVIKNRAVTVTQVREIITKMTAVGGHVRGILLVK